VAKLATLSDGTVFEPVNSFQKNQKTPARLQRQLSRKVKFSNNWQKQKRKIQRLHSRLSQSKFRCQVCGYTANADVNGARNILAAGHAVLACGEMVQSGRPLKQEPTEMIQATA
ncbi:transposase, partial [Escherichia coli]